MSNPQETSEGFLLHAREFLVAAELVLNRASGVSLPAYFLFGRSIELSLKAYLLARGITAKQLKSRKFGHNLASLFAEAVELGLRDQVDIEMMEASVVELLNGDYMEKRLEYRVTSGIYYLPNIEFTEQIARKLVGGLEGVCRSARVQ